MRIFSILVMLAAGAALWIYGLPMLQEREQATQAASSEARLFPELGQTINDARALEIEAAGDSFTLQRGEDGSWTLADKAGFPADTEKVQKLLMALYEAEIVEEKTSNPDLYHRLVVNEPAEDNEAKRVTVLDGSQARLASLIVGKAPESARNAGAFFVRRSDEAPSWLVQANLEVPSQENDWLDRDLLDLSADRIQAVEIRHGDGERIYALKPDDSATDMEIEGIPEGKELRYASIGNSLASGLQRLTMDDVAAEEIAFDNPPQAVATFWTFDGLKVEVSTHEVDEKLYARFETSYDEAGAPGAAVEMGPPAPEETTGLEDTEGGEGLEEELPEAPEEASPEEIQAEATELSGRLGTWTFVLPSWKKSTFQKRMDDLIRDIPAPEPPPLLVDPQGEGESPIPLGPPEPVEEQGGGEDPEEVPATEVPATEVPATEVPATEVPATEVPATEVPATEVPATEDPATGGGEPEPDAGGGPPTTDPDAGTGSTPPAEPEPGGGGTEDPPEPDPTGGGGID